MTSFYRISIKVFSLPPLEVVGAIHETHSFLSICELSPTPLYEVCVIYEKFKFGMRDFSL
jgi:hypothetical protein